MEIGAYEAAQREKARALKRKFYPHQKVKPAPLLIKKAVIVEKPEWRKKDMWFHEHVIAFRVAMAFRDKIASFKTSAEMNIDPLPTVSRRSMLEISKDVLVNHPGVTFLDVRSHRRARYIVRARHDIIRAIVSERPDLSYPAIGRFLERDHTSILSAAGKLARKPSTWSDK